MGLLEVKNLTFGYDNQTENVFDNISFKIDTNWKLGLIGRNGKGKTTLLNLFCGNYDYQGETLSGQPISYLPEYSQPSDSPNTWIADFNVMQLQTDSDTRLKIYSPEKELQYNEKLISGLLAENPDIDFNSDHDFTIEITFDSYYVPVSIRINDWEIIIEEAVLPFFSPIKYMPEQRMSGRDQRMIELPDFLQSDLLHYPFGASVG